MKKILIIDDSPSYAYALRNHLQSEYEIVVATNLQQAKKVTTKDIDIFLVDIRLDEKDIDNEDGLVFLEWVKSKYPEKPVILMTAYKEFEERREELIKKGASDLMTKPIFLSDLKKKLNKLLKYPKSITPNG
jgi:DNA-binding NtrC family response regulator